MYTEGVTAFRFLLTGLLVLAASTAHAQSVEIQTEKPLLPPDKELRTYVNIRAGAVAAQTGSGRRPNICLEASPWAPLSVETCGTGSGFIHDDPAPEMAHFRAHFRLAEWRAGKARLRPRIGAGMAELQTGKDAPGFRFADAGGGISTAGPETLGSLQVVHPAGGGFELVAEAHMGAAYLAHAPALTPRFDATQPFGGVTVGIGF